MIPFNTLISTMMIMLTITATAYTNSKCLEPSCCLVFLYPKGICPRTRKPCTYHLRVVSKLCVGVKEKHNPQPRNTQPFTHSPLPLPYIKFISRPYHLLISYLTLVVDSTSPCHPVSNVRILRAFRKLISQSPPSTTLRQKSEPVPKNRFLSVPFIQRLFHPPSNNNGCHQRYSTKCL
jgi:hypothetical protein